MNTFENAQKHENEIISSRLGGLGGSDAALVLKIGERGLSALSATDNKRLAVMLGLAEYKPFAGNEYTRAGHLFEDAAESLMLEVYGCVRELKMQATLAKNFITFAHADFADIDDVKKVDCVVECKFTNKSTAETAATYAAQLQWYYLLGAKNVRLYHGMGDAEPFAIHNAEMVEIERDENTIKTLLQGIKTLDDAITSGWRPSGGAVTSYDKTPAMVQQALIDLADAKEMQNVAKGKEKAAKDVLFEYMVDESLATIKTIDGEGKAHAVSLTQGKQTRTFNSKAFIKALAAKYGEGSDMVTEVLELFDAAYTESTSAPSISYR